MRVEFRDRSRRAPDGGFRFVLGTATSKRAAVRLQRQRELCQAIARRGEWDVLRAAKAGTVTIDEVERLVAAYGWDHYRGHLSLGAAPSDAPSLEEHVARWLADGVSHNGTRAVYEHGLRQLTGFKVDGAPLGARPWYEIHKHEVQDAISEARRRVAENTARTFLGAWGSFFTWAIDREDSEAEAEGRAPRITESPIQRAKRWGKPRTTRHRFFRPAEYRDLLDATIVPMRAQYAALALTGMRIGEFCALPPEHVRLPTKISVGPWGNWRPKNERGVRDIPVHRTELLPLLEEYAAEYAGDREFFVNPQTGDGWSYGAFKRRMKADVTAAGLVYGQRRDGIVQPDGVSPHTFRHTFATWLCQRDVQLVKIAALLGDTVETVRVHYAHHLPTDLDRAVNVLEI